MNKQPAVVNYAHEPMSVELREIDVPEIGPNDTLMQVAAVGVCGSDLHQWAGLHSWPVNYPVTLGHEFAGRIVKTGDASLALELEERGYGWIDQTVSVAA